jgi:hypothetical protein
LSEAATKRTRSIRLVQREQANFAQIFRIEHGRRETCGVSAATLEPGSPAGWERILL